MSLGGLLGAAIAGGAQGGYEQHQFNQKKKAQEEADQRRYDREEALAQMRIESNERQTAAQITARRMSDELKIKQHDEEMAQRERLAEKPNEQNWSAVTDDGVVLGFLEKKTGQWLTPEQMSNPTMDADFGGLKLPSSGGSNPNSQAAAAKTGTATGTPLLEAANDFVPKDEDKPSFLEVAGEDLTRWQKEFSDDVGAAVDDAIEFGPGFIKEQLSMGGQNPTPVPDENFEGMFDREQPAPSGPLGMTADEVTQVEGNEGAIAKRADTAYAWVQSRHPNLGMGVRSEVATMLHRIQRGDTIGPNEAQRVGKYLPPSWQQKMRKLIK